MAVETLATDEDDARTVFFSDSNTRLRPGSHDLQDVENQTVSCHFPAVSPFSKGSSVVLSLPAAGGTAVGLRLSACGWRVSRNVV